MKAIIRGLEIECSVEEFKELTNDIIDKSYEEEIDEDIADDDYDSEESPKVSMPKIPLNNVKHRIARSSYAHWTKSDLRLLKENKDLSMNKLLKMFKDRSYDAIKCQLFKMFHNKRKARKNNPNNKNIVRFKYLNSRAKTLISEGMKRNDALKKASLEWNLVEKVKQNNVGE